MLLRYRRETKIIVKDQEQNITKRYTMIFRVGNIKVTCYIVHLFVPHKYFDGALGTTQQGVIMCGIRG